MPIVTGVWARRFNKEMVDTDVRDDSVEPVSATQPASEVDGDRAGGPAGKHSVEPATVRAGENSPDPAVEAEKDRR